MPMINAYVAELNSHFTRGRIGYLVKRKDQFAPGKPLDLGFAAEQGSADQAMWTRHLASMPPLIQDSMRSVIHHALSSTPPRQVTFAWAPAYDNEISIWDAPCGITVLIKSRYPADTEPNRGD